MAVELIYETHATTTDNEAGIATGRLPGLLSERGRRQARELGERRRGQDIAAVYTSDLHRAVETAALAFPDGRPPVHRDPRLRECDYGTLNGHPAGLVAAQRLRRVDEPFPGGGQSYRQVLAATDALLHDLARRWDGRRVLLISHSANRWALACLLGGVPLTESVRAPFVWQPGWTYTLPGDWPGPGRGGSY
ncbi:histidine phosphatase family protein [Streptomyces sp. NPDC059718]